MLDSNAFDDILETDDGCDLLAEAKDRHDIRLIVTYVQPWEHGNTPDDKAEKRRRLLDLASECVAVPGAGWVVGLSPIGQFYLAPEDIEAFLDPNRSNAPDAVIAATALRRNAVLVTNDKNLIRDYRAAGGQVWKPVQLLAALRDLGRQRPLADPLDDSASDEVLPDIATGGTR